MSGADHLELGNSSSPAASDCRVGFNTSSGISMCPAAQMLGCEIEGGSQEESCGAGW